jgi:hypothetical protein
MHTAIPITAPLEAAHISAEEPRPTMPAIVALTLSALTVFASVWAVTLSLAVNQISHLQTIIVK